MVELSLIPTNSSHINRFFEFESDDLAAHMAAFATLATDRAKFTETWNRRLNNHKNLHQTILLEDKIVGGIISYFMEDSRHIGYWIDRNHWGKGIATQALTKFLDIEKTRPLIATCVADNIGSRRVLEKNNFQYTHSESHHASARNEVVEEAFFILK